DALVSVGTHDLPTLAGWWRGRDLEVRRELGASSDEETQVRRIARSRDRVLLLEALVRARRLPRDTDVAAAAGGPLTTAIVEAVHVWLATTPARLMMLQPEDWLGVTEQANLPGTVDTHPNWRRKLPLAVEDLAVDPAAARLAAALAAHRETPHRKA